MLAYAIKLHVTIKQILNFEIGFISSNSSVDLKGDGNAGSKWIQILKILHDWIQNQVAVHHEDPHSLQGIFGYI